MKISISCMVTPPDPKRTMKTNFFGQILHFIIFKKETFDLEGKESGRFCMES